MLKFITKLIMWLDKIRLSLVFRKRRKNCQCLCDLCERDCPVKDKIHHLDIE